MKKCINCFYFEERTHFCRKNPPIPKEKIITVKDKDGKLKKVKKMTAIYPIIVDPERDFCGEFKDKSYTGDISEGQDLLNEVVVDNHEKLI